MRSRGLVSKPQGEAGPKPAHAAHFLHVGVIGLDLISNALGNWYRNKVNQGQNQLTMYIFSIPGSVVGSSCHVLWGPRVQTTR